MTRLFLLLTLMASSTCLLADDELRTITVTGVGLATAMPDKAIVRMSIVAQEKTLSTAQKKAGDVTANVLQLTDELDIDRDHVDTTGSSVRPDYRWNRTTEEQELWGYVAERQMTVDVLDLEQLGPLVEGAVSAGVNQVMPPQLDSTRRRDVHRDALANAALDARANAERLAEVLDVRLGKATRVSSGVNSQPPPMPYRMQATIQMESDAAETYNPGSLDVSATVTVVFELID